MRCAYCDNEAVGFVNQSVKHVHSDAVISCIMPICTKCLNGLVNLKPAEPPKPDTTPETKQ